jgi:hypothetical protein
MGTIFGLIIVLGIGKLLFGDSGKTESREERKKQTFLEYPEGGYGLDDDPVTDELMFLDIMDGDRD